MPQETRQRSNRDTIADLLRKAARSLSKSIEDGAKGLQYIQAAQGFVGTADQLAKAKPIKGARMQPAAVRRKVERAKNLLERLAKEIQEVPVTAHEKANAIVRTRKRRTV